MLKSSSYLTLFIRLEGSRPQLNAYETPKQKTSSPTCGKEDLQQRAFESSKSTEPEMATEEISLAYVEDILRRFVGNDRLTSGGIIFGPGESKRGKESSAAASKHCRSAKRRLKA